MEKSRNFQIIYAGRTTLWKQTNWPLTKLGVPQPPHYPIGVKRVYVNSPNVEGTVFQTFLNYKQRSCIQFITNEQVKLISFICEGVDFTLGIRCVPLTGISEGMLTTLTLTHSPANSYPLNHSLSHSRNHSVTQSLSHSLTHSLTHSGTHSLTHSLTML